MTLLLWTLLIASLYPLFWLLIVGFIIIRLDWVSKRRAEVLRLDGPTVYEALASFDTMFAKFWVWDVWKFLGRHAATVEEDTP